MERKRTLMMAMARTRRAWNNHVKEVAHAIGIPDSYRMVISYLHRNPGANQRNIAEYADVTTSAVNQTVKSMLEEGYLRKEKDDCDKRHSKLFLTDKGEDVGTKLRERLSASDEIITELVTLEKEEELIALLDKITDCIRRDLTSC